MKNTKKKKKNAVVYCESRETNLSFAKIDLSRFRNYVYLHVNPGSIGHLFSYLLIVSYSADYRLKFIRNIQE